MNKRLRFVAIAAALIVLGWAASKIFAPGKSPDIFEGYVEGDLSQIGPIEGERLAQLEVQPGSQVKKGALLFTMATPVLDEQRAEAVARVEQAQANLENLKAALNRPEQIAVLKATLARADASLVLSQTEYDRQVYLLPKGATTVAARDQAKFALDRDKAAVAEAQRQIDAALLPSRTHEIAAAEAAISEDQAQLQQIETRIGRQSVHAPEDGIIQDVFFWPGEVVAAGQPVLALLPPENRKIRFYVPETQLARFSLGAKVAVSCDNCPAGLETRVIYISQQAEFTPPVIFSLQERGKLVFRIDARPDGDNLSLPLGLPISARLAESGKAP
ncbi:HlyD family secretion protein [Rhodoblastus sp.]|uniref:HlyD family secretion protein n=1 Tax=Rhodoblastus sp. TaxID=1962975 RepID=UPI003F9E156C